jgi:hypothetical protein
MSRTEPPDELGRRLSERVRRRVLRRVLFSSPKYEDLFLDRWAARLRVRFGLTDMTDGQVRAALERALRKVEEKLLRETDGDAGAAPREACEVIDIRSGASVDAR